MSENILDLDIGNSRIKWRLSAGRYGVNETNVLEDFFAIDFGVLDRVRISCVSNKNTQGRVVDFFSQKCLHDPEVAVSQSYCAGLKNNYKYSESLGVDRWLASLAAWKKTEKNAILVIDAGSALTIDTVSDKAEFLGGYIIPGLEMMQKALVGNTGKIACTIDARFYNDDRLPADTQEAVQGGACFATLAAVERAVRLFLQRWPNGKICFTGGSGGALALSLAMPEVYHPDLVLDGLAIALP